MKSKTTVCAYCRVSTNSKDQENSFENQKNYFDREIMKNKKYVLYKIYADRGVSGTKLKRPEFDKLIYDAGLDVQMVTNYDNDERKSMIKYVTVPSSSRRPKFNLILVKDTSRFARNVLVEDILRDLKKVGVYVHFLDLDKTTEREEDITYIQLFQTFAERESRDKSKKVLFGVEQGAQKGTINPGHNLYGYEYIKDENRLVIIPEEAEVILDIFEQYSNGLGIRRIINYLNGKTVTTRNGKEFCKSTIKRILTNEKYIGESIRRKYDTGLVFNKNSYAKIRPEDEQLYMGKTEKIPQIVPDELFYKCNNMLKNNVNSESQKGHFKGFSEYAGLIFCGTCGNVYISNVDRGRKFYNCKLKKQKGTSSCSNPNISLKLIEETIEKERQITSMYDRL